MSKLSPENKVNEVFALYESYGNADYIGEPVSQIEHMSQAAQMAADEGYGNEVILAAFFHDLGHLFSQRDELEQMSGYGVMDHETFQGGVMTAEEAREFEADPQHKLILKMREWDERAKEIGVPVPKMDAYKKMALELLT